ncbi:anhydro-N-acetylmuramic acid kinase [Marinobacter daqiaonensis]|uniref:Anhydro-N-acetylmuramic acid kinase n=1 Tax=Marinobacter daqiaonensis TaxID=650891 RepID=A0A1I6JWW7_9GAMM|nr:anhydro-N-acetylmuramic acid kinase [Marinobacter daqiaonensis]SFR83494.1 anhydro-N-acetylmuramic acid kinase [Marinobacter daqiaonensis]
MALFIGLMSGTSMDGIDAVLVRFGDRGPEILASHSQPFPSPLLQILTRLSQNSGTPDDLGYSDHLLGEQFAQAVHGLLNITDGITAADIRAIGSHGQTIRHQPGGNTPFTLQIGDPNVIAERTGITTVADFRRRDMAAGGQGAPLVPAFHHAAFSSSRENRVLVNIGGIANITWLPAGKASADGGFDTGPGNGLMDAWCQKHKDHPFDMDGHWAMTGTVTNDLLQHFLADRYFRKQPPKSTGKEYFNLGWLNSNLATYAKVPEADVQRTLLELTATTIANQLPESRPLSVFVCGGGAKNRALMARLGELTSGDDIHLATTGDLGIDPQWVEAAAFAWLARETLEGRPGNVPAVTGAKGERILGAIYPA